MAFDVYVGPLSRYYSGDWETVGAVAARQMGIGYQVVRPNAKPEPLLGRALSALGLRARKPEPSPEQIREAVIRWRGDVSEFLSASEQVVLDWNDDPNGAYFTDRPNWDGYEALRVLAMRAEFPALPAPGLVDAGWWDLPEVKAAVEAPGRVSTFNHVDGPEVWLPADFEAPLIASLPVSAAETCVGSADRLLRQLRELNACTFHADRPSMDRWAREGVESESPYEVHARYGLALFTQLAELAVQHRLPMLLDY